jgi:hypothetical protein
VGANGGVVHKDLKTPHKVAWQVPEEGMFNLPGPMGGSGGMNVSALQGFQSGYPVLLRESLHAQSDDAKACPEEAAAAAARAEDSPVATFATAAEVRDNYSLPLCIFPVTLYIVFGARTLLLIPAPQRCFSLVCSTAGNSSFTCLFWQA